MAVPVESLEPTFSDPQIREYLDRNPDVLSHFLRREARRDPLWLTAFLRREQRIDLGRVLR